MADWERVVSVGTVIGQHAPIQPSLQWEHSYLVKLPHFNPIITYLQKYDEFYLMLIHISPIHHMIYDFLSQFLNTIQYVLFIIIVNYNPKR